MCSLLWKWYVIFRIFLDMFGSIRYPQVLAGYPQSSSAVHCFIDFTLWESKMAWKITYGLKYIKMGSQGPFPLGIKHSLPALPKGTYMVSHIVQPLHRRRRHSNFHHRRCCCGSNCWACRQGHGRRRGLGADSWRGDSSGLFLIIQNIIGMNYIEDCGRIIRRY